VDTKLPLGESGENEPVLRAADRRKLERLAKRLAADRAALRQAMRDAQAAGASLREIADATGLSHTGVRRQLREPGDDDNGDELG
jgi:DNA invertase Pin-like site-specific DNA recombinase